MRMKTHRSNQRMIDSIQSMIILKKQDNQSLVNSDSRNEQFVVDTIKNETPLRAWSIINEYIGRLVYCDALKTMEFFIKMQEHLVVE